MVHYPSDTMGTNSNQPDNSAITGSLVTAGTQKKTEKAFKTRIKGTVAQNAS